MRKNLKNKKGFTLVELIVVIAIIAVLAAILIPTLVGYVTKSHVSNMNATAGKMRDNVSYFLTQADADGYGMFVSHSAVCDVDIQITGGKWLVTTSDKDVFVQHYNTKWMGSGQGWLDDTNALSDCAEDKLASFLANTFRDITEGYVRFRLVGGVCSVLYVTTEQTTPVTSLPPFGTSTDWSVDRFDWDGTNQGVTTEGIVVGTSPVLLF